MALLLICFWKQFVTGLSSPLWQGIAGIAQITAGILAVITIMQARDMQKQADIARRESVAPDWEIISVRSLANVYLSNPNKDFTLCFENTGFGLAKDVNIIFQPIKKETVVKLSEPSMDTSHSKGHGRYYSPEDWIKVTLSFHTDQLPFEGYYILTSSSRFCERLEHKFKMSLEKDKNNIINFHYEKVEYRFLKP